MWADEVVPRLEAARSRRTEVAARTYRLTGIGESQVAELLGESMLRADQPDRRDLRPSRGGRRPDLGRRRRRPVRRRAGRSRCRARSSATSGATSGRPARRPGARPSARGSASSAGRCRSSRSGRAARSARCSATWPRLRFDESIALDAPAAMAHRPSSGHGRRAERRGDDESPDDLIRYAHRARELGGSEVGLAVRTRTRTGDMVVSIAVATPSGDRQQRRVVFLTGQMGRLRAALSSASALLDILREEDPATDRPGRAGAAS